MRRVSYPILILILAILGLTASSIAFQEFDLSLGGTTFHRGSDTILGLQLGLDLQGGSHLVYQAERTDPSNQQIDSALRGIQERVDAAGVEGSRVQRLERDGILVQFPGIADVEEARSHVGQGERWEFREGVTLQEGSTLVYQLDTDSPTPQLLRDVTTTIRQRLDDAEVESPVVRPLGEKSVLVHFPGLMDGEEARGLVGDVPGTRLNEEVEVGAGALLFYEAQGDDPTRDQIEGVMSTIRNRVDAFGVSEPIIQRLGESRILVQLPGVTDLERAKELIGRTASLEFKERECVGDPCNIPGNFIDKDTGLTGDDLDDAFASQDPVTGEPVVSFEFKPDAARTFGELTTRLARTNGRIAIFLDGEELIAPTVRQSILRGAGFISGSQLAPFTPEETRTLAIQLKSGILPVSIDLIQERDVDAILGKESLQRSLTAALIGLALVMFFMVLYYRVPGVVASLSLIAYAVIVLGVFKLLPVTLTLAGGAAFILSIGLAVDANVLIFERMKEELRAGHPLFRAMQIGFSRAWPAIRDGNVSTFITCAILFWFGQRLGTSVVQGFALTLFIGVATSMFSAITVTRTFLLIVANTPLGRHRSWFSPEGLARPGEEPASQAVEEAGWR